MAGNPRLFIEVAGDDTKLKKTLKNSERETKRWASKIEQISAGSRLGGAGALGGLGKAGLAGGATLGLGLAISKMGEFVSAASDLNEQQTKNKAVFGQSAQVIEKWSSTTAEAFGISKRAALEATGTFGNLFSVVGIAGRSAGDMSQRLVELAADLASFNNASPEDTLDAIRSGLIGEAEPLRRFGVLLSEARVQQLAMSETGKTNAKSLTNQEKALARYHIILQDTTKAQGDFERTSGGLANQQRTLKAQQEDLSASIGGALMPIYIRFFETANKGIDVLKETKTNLEGAGEATKDWTDKILDLKDALNLPGFHSSNFVRLTDEARAQAEAAIAPGEGHLGSTNLGKPKPTTTTGGSGGVTAEQRNRWFDSDITRRLDKVQDIGTLKGQIAALDTIAGLIQQRIKVTKDITRKLSLEDQLRQVAREKAGLGDQIVANAAEAKLQAKALAEQQESTRLAQRTARQFRMLGLTETGDPVTASKANLKKRVENIANRIGGTKFDTPKLRTQLERFRKVLAEGLVPKDVRARIQSMLDDVNSTLNANAKKGGPLTKTTQLNVDRILEGLGLGGDAERILRARLSHFNSAGSSLTGSGTGSRNTVIPVTVTVDGKVLGKTTAKYQGRTRSVNTPQRNGPNPGGYVGA